MPETTRDNSERKEVAAHTPAKSKLSKKNRCNDIDSGKFLLELYQKALLLSEKELNDYFLDHAVSLTGSAVGFFHFISDDQKSIILTAWNGEALKNCVANYSTHYPIDLAGNWVDCIRSGRPIIYNDYAKSPNQKGVPSGHVLIKRFMSTPIFENGKIKIVFGVGNKIDPYHEDDVVQLQLIANELSKIYKQRQAEYTIRESEKKYRSLFENMLDGFAYCRMIFDEKGNPVDFEYLEINDAFEQLTGLKREAVVGKRVTEAIPGIENANPELFEIYGRVALTCQKEKFEIFFKPLKLWLSVSVYCPRKGYFAAIFEDITERKRLEEETHRLLGVVQQERDRLSSLLNSINDEVWFADTEKKFTLANPSAVKEFKLDSSAQNVDVEDLTASLEVHRPDGSLRPVEEAPPLRALKGEVLTNQEEIVRIPASGELRYRQVSAAPVRDSEGNIIGSISVVRDITELKQLQNRLQKHAEDLEKLVEERTRQLKDSERLATIGATAGMVGHDIRNPLQAITSDVYLAKTELASTSESEERKNAIENLQEIEKNIDYINKIVADLQDFARPLNPHAEEADLKLIIEELLSKNGLPQNVKVSVKVETEAMKVVADSSYINRILYNLVTNAVQAMPKSGKLTIHAYKEANDVIITVKDTGVGIPEKEKGKLFTPMFTTKAKGQGFGLSVVKRMTEALGGTVTFDSQEGKGTTFVVRLPPIKESKR